MREHFDMIRQILSLTVIKNTYLETKEKVKTPEM